MIQLVHDTRAEPGCISHVLHRGDDDPNALVQQRQFRALWQDHVNGAAIDAFCARGGEDKIAQAEVHALNVAA